MANSNYWESLYDQTKYKTQICPTCHGKREHLVMGEETCPQCGGTGRDNTSDLLHDYCKKCSGNRKVYYCRHEPCSTCRGKGTI